MNNLFGIHICPVEGGIIRTQRPKFHQNPIPMILYFYRIALHRHNRWFRHGSDSVAKTLRQVRS